jgi:hypothetical protein
MEAAGCSETFVPIYQSTGLTFQKTVILSSIILPVESKMAESWGNPLRLGAQARLGTYGLSKQKNMT